MEESLDDLIARTFPDSLDRLDMFMANRIGRFVAYTETQGFVTWPVARARRRHGRIHGIAAAQAYLAGKREARKTRRIMAKMLTIATLYFLAGYIAG